MTKLVSVVVGTLALNLVLLAPAAAQTKGSAGASAESMSPADKSFVEEAAAGGLAEVELGQLAREKAQSEEVKKFGQHMIDDHSKANGELKALAAKKGMTVPAELAPKHKALKEKLMKLSGADFDKQYMREMVKDHEKDVAAFQKESTGGKDPDLTTWAKQTLPTLQGHLTMARDTEAKVKKGPGKGQ
jgi:putative membrane protein